MGLASQRGLSLASSVPEALVQARVDPTRVTQVIGNLLHNALKFTPAPGRITTMLSVQEQHAVVVVADEGVGIAPELVARVCEPFTQAEVTLARSNGGLGLGLALAKGLVELHGGRLDVASPGIGRGTTVRVWLPVDLARAETDAESPVRTPTDHLRILLVDDNEDLADSLRDLLELDGHHVNVARTASEGLVLARTLAPHLILCDIGLPDRDGYAFITELRADPRLERTYTVALTGYSTARDKHRAEQAGFSGHLAKPASPESIAAVIAAAHATLG